MVELKFVSVVFGISFYKQNRVCYYIFYLLVFVFYRNSIKNNVKMAIRKSELEVTKTAFLKNIMINMTFQQKE